jgi:Tfp pilus assembly protein PilV
MTRRRGLNLMENVLAFTVLTLGMVAFVALLNSGFLLNRRSERQIHAEQLLEQLMEFYAEDVHRLPDGSYDLPYKQDLTGATYRCSVQLSTYATDPLVRTVEVTARFEHQQVRQRRRRICDIPR